MSRGKRKVIARGGKCGRVGEKTNKDLSEACDCMKKYEYKFVEIQRETGLKVKTGDTFEKCKQAIVAEAEQGWQLKQIISPFNEKAGVYAPYSYQIIFEREV